MKLIHRCSYYLINRHTYRVYESNLHCWQLVFFFSVHHVLQEENDTLKLLCNLHCRENVTHNRCNVEFFSFDITLLKELTRDQVGHLKQNVPLYYESKCIKRELSHTLWRECSFVVWVIVWNIIRPHNTPVAQNALIQMRLGEMRYTKETVAQ